MIEGREGGTTLRYVHSGIFDDEGWDDQYDAVPQHTDFYLHTLGQYLAHFAPRTATYVGDGPGGLSAPEASMRPDGFDRLKAALGVDGASEGDRGAPRLGRPTSTACSTTSRRNFVGIRTGRRAVPLLRAQRVRRAGRDGAARLRRRRRRAAQAGAPGLAGRASTTEEARMGAIHVHEFMSARRRDRRAGLDVRLRLRPEDGRGHRGVHRRGRRGSCSGATTYEMFEPAWSTRTVEDDPGAPFFNDTTKYVVSGTLDRSDVAQLRGRSGPTTPTGSAGSRTRSATSTSAAASRSCARCSPTAWSTSCTCSSTR